MRLSVLLAVLAAGCLGVAAVVQQRAARSQDAHRPFSLLLIRELTRNRLWLVAVAVMVCGYACQAAALGLGSLTVVEPILAGYLVVALFLAWIWAGARITTSAVVAALATSAGIAVFVIVSHPIAGRSQASGAGWAVVLTVLALGLAAGGRTGTRMRPTSRPALLALVAGVALGCSDALTKQTLGVFSAAHLGGFTDWPLYVLTVEGAVAFLAQQSAYHAGPLASSLPVLSVTEPLIGILLGIALFGESPTTHGLGGLLLLGCALVGMVWGMSELGRAPLRGQPVEAELPGTPTGG